MYSTEIFNNLLQVLIENGTDVDGQQFLTSMEDKDIKPDAVSLLINYLFYMNFQEINGLGMGSVFSHFSIILYAA